MTGVRQGKIQIQQVLVSTKMNVFNKFKINPLGFLSGNVWPPWKCDGWTDRQMTIRMNGQKNPFLC